MVSEGIALSCATLSGALIGAGVLMAGRRVALALHVEGIRLRTEIRAVAAGRSRFEADAPTAPSGKAA